MTVYFVSPVDNPDLIKIGHSDELDERLRTLGGAYECGIRLLAQCEGTTETESAFHLMFANERVEGEWFARNELLDGIVERLKPNIAGQTVFGLRKRHTGIESPVETDRRIAKKLLCDLMSSERTGTKMAAAHERAFQTLHAMNPSWSRRRVRAIWEGAPKRIEFYEIRDLDVAANPNRRADWAVWICPEIEEQDE